MTLCEHALAYIGMGLATYFWLWYLTEEGNRYKGKGKDRWYHKKLTDLRLFRRGDDV